MFITNHVPFMYTEYITFDVIDLLNSYFYNSSNHTHILI